MVIADFYPGIGGEERQAQSLSKAMIRRGWSVRVLTRRHGYPHSRALSNNDSVQGIPVRRVFSRGLGRLGSIVYMLSALWHLALHGRGGVYTALDVGAPGWIAVVARYLLGGRSVVKLRSGRDDYEMRMSSRLGRWQLCKLLHLADRVIVVNHDLERFLEELGLRAPKVACIPNGVDCTLYRPDVPEEKVAARRSLALPTNKTVVLFVGRLEPVKGVDLLLAAWAQLSDHVRAKALLILVGDGTERENLKTMTVSLGIEQSAILTGPKQSVRQYYAAADVFVLPSRSEGMPLALLEAMACGLPSIVSNVGGVPEVIRHGINGLLFEPEDCRKLAEELASELTREDQRRLRGQRARRCILRHMNVDDAVEKVNDICSVLSE